MSLDQTRFDQPQAALPRLRARLGGHAYDLHRHETYAVGVTLWGAQPFHYRGALETSRGGQVRVIHPDEAHDGHAGVDDGFAYRMLYVDPASVSAALDGASPPFVPDVVADDAVLADLLGEAFADFPQPLEPLAVDAVVERLPGRLVPPTPDLPRPRPRPPPSPPRARGAGKGHSHRGPQAGQRGRPTHEGVRRRAGGGEPRLEERRQQMAGLAVEADGRAAALREQGRSRIETGTLGERTCQRMGV